MKTFIRTEYFESEDAIIWNSIQDAEIKHLKALTNGMELLERMETIYAYLDDVELSLKMKWLILSKEQGTYNIEYFCEAWK
jgi:hypothetical protein